jgi:hypothetical protein
MNGHMYRFSCRDRTVNLMLGTLSCIVHTDMQLKRTGFRKTAGFYFPSISDRCKQPWKLTRL